MASGWQHIREARHTRIGTVADLKMKNGRIYRAVWDCNGRMTAWWPRDKRRKRAIGLYTPEAFRIVAVGILPHDYFYAA